jgi:type IV pilus assembly protein PilB
MVEKVHKPLGVLLVENELLTEKDLEAALERQHSTGELLGQVLTNMGLVSEKDILSALQAQSGMRVVNLASYEPGKEVLDRVSGAVARIYKILPLEFDDNTLVIAMADPLDIQTLDDLKFMLNCDVKGTIASEDDIVRAIDKYYGTEMETVGDLLKQIETEMGGAVTIEAGKEESQSIDLASLKELAEQAPVVKLLNLVLIQAIRDRGSDIHFEPFEDQFKIRYRVDGVLYEMVPPPKHLSLAITSRIKVMANMDIAERRLPQDGRIQLSMKGKGVDLRVSTLPTIFGESIVMRILDRSIVMLELEQVGLSEQDRKAVGEIIKKPNGIILATGPTGCGKTTTLYSCLKDLNEIDVKIITTEDPVEYDIPGIIQIHINEAIGLTFAICLRHILRQDPDIILVGEIRDKETTDMAIQSSLTGHLVLSTLHTNDAAGAITRLIDMEVEPFLITSTLEAIIAQRLVRTVCNNCKEQYEPTEDELSSLKLKREDIKGKIFSRGKGCDVCKNIGYLGRTGIFELLVVEEGLRSLVLKKAATKDLRNVAKEAGMKTLREDGLEKIFAGITTIEEVARETMAQE